MERYGHGGKSNLTNHGNPLPSEEQSSASQTPTHTQTITIDGLNGLDGWSETSNLTLSGTLVIGGTFQVSVDTSLGEVSLMREGVMLTTFNLGSTLSIDSITLSEATYQSECSSPSETTSEESGGQ